MATAKRPSAYTRYLAQRVAESVPGTTTYVESIAIALSDAIAAYPESESDADADADSDSVLDTE